MSDRIVKNRWVRGGSACVAGTRIAVWVIEAYRRAGFGQRDMLRMWPSLSAADLSAARTYAIQNRDEIEEELSANDAFGTA